MKKLRVGIVGFGFIGPHHLDAIRRTRTSAKSPAIATINPSSDARAKAEQYHVARPSDPGSELVADPEIDVVDVATPTESPLPWSPSPPPAAGKHVIVDKPLSLTSVEARQYACRRATRRGRPRRHLQHPLQRHAPAGPRARRPAASSATCASCVATTWQEWLLKRHRLQLAPASPTRPVRSRMVSDCGAHWYDHSATRHRPTHRASPRRLLLLYSYPPPPGRRFPRGPRCKQEPHHGLRVPEPGLGLILCEFENGARGQSSATSALSPGHKNDLTIEVTAAHAVLASAGSRSVPTSCGSAAGTQPNQLLRSRIPPCSIPPCAHYAALPGGHAEAWPDAFRNLMRNILGFIAAGRDPREADGADFATFATGVEIAAIVDAIAASARAGGRWTRVRR
jgi:predicted dehydrogenase